MIVIENRNRKIRVVFRISEDERELIEKKMKEGNIQNREAYLRKMALDGFIVRVDLSDVNRLVFLLQNATNNLNQIARRVNETGHIYGEDIKDLQNHYDQLWGTAKEILYKLEKI